MAMKFLLSVAITLTICAALTAGESIDFEDAGRFCYPEQHKNTRRSCECGVELPTNLGLHALRIDCSFKDFRTKDLSAALPVYANSLDLSWNALDVVPVFVGDKLRMVNLMHNNISKISSKGFEKLPNIRELYLSWNSIQTIEPHAFDGLTNLQILDISHNNLHALGTQIFGTLLQMTELDLSWNRQLNRTADIEQRDMYELLGINTQLRSLKLQACSLSSLVLPEKAKLEELDLRRNSLTEIPKRMPLFLRKLDLSDNLVETLRLSDSARVPWLYELYLEDMPRLLAIEANSFEPLYELKKISFQNSRRLNSFHGEAFGVNATKLPPLKVMNFRGTALRGFNATLAPVFEQLTELDLNGMPLYCDCQLIWVKELKLETNGRCFKPSRLSGMLLSNAQVTDFSCNAWPRWVYGLIILGLLVVCSTGIYLIGMGLRPNRGVTMRRKVGAGSPYARVTIEPNRQEGDHY